MPSQPSLPPPQTAAVTHFESITVFVSPGSVVMHIRPMMLHVGANESLDLERHASVRGQEFDHDIWNVSEWIDMG